jgi:membrane associated rhomboid family serine protease
LDEPSTDRSRELVEVYRAAAERAVRHRALVLRAREIPFLQRRAGAQHVLHVPGPWADQARAELELYERENRGWPPRDVFPVPAPGALRSAGLFALVLIVAFALQRSVAFGLGWKAAGLASAQAIRAGEVWRAATALTLHSDFVHLLGNVLFGALFGALAAQALGAGPGWLLVLATGVLGNWTNAWVSGPAHASLGASTAVFGALGLAAGAEWRRRHELAHPWIRRLAPLLGGAFFFAWLGVSARDVPGEFGGPVRVDVLAHLFGLAWGLVLGVLFGRLAARARSGSVRWITGLATLAILATAWALALAPTG